ncbi:MAG TPA: nicotinate-nucleotide adenylyltransferase [bacterium]|nr:nicotinate-nucleotide adenylyltransferase [bacterium]
MKAVAIFGGTFNPIHFGHLCIAEEIRTKFNLDKVIFVPTNLPPHKNPSDLVSARQRWLMTHLATVSNPCFEVSTFEIDSGGKSYAVDTIKHFRKHFGDKVKIYFIIGADMLVDIAAWKNIGEILKLCRFIAVSRPGYDVQKIFNQYYLSSKNTSIASELMENVLVEDVATLDISSTSIRQRVKEWKSIKYLVPETVEQFMHNQQLYL